MSFSRPVRHHTGRVVGKKSKVMKPSTPEAKKHIESSHYKSSSVSPHHKHTTPDSGFFEKADNDLSCSDDDNLPSSCYNNPDWILFGDKDIAQDDEYYFQEDDATDIASVKANHGSHYNGKNNEDNTLTAKRSSASTRGKQPLSVIYESPRRNEPPQHTFSHHPATQYGVSTLQTWVRTPEEHEKLAYRFEQPLNPSYVFRDMQQFWDGDIDLSLYEVQH